MEEIISLLHSIRRLSPELEEHLRRILRQFTYRKKELLLKTGDIASHILFIQKGLIRSFSMIKGQDVSHWFMKEGDIIISVESFLWQTLSDEFIQALEECECWGITRAELWETYERFPEFLWHGLLITNIYYTRSIKRERTHRRLRPRDKYALMMKADQELIRRVPNKHMASYLDVSIRTYASIRKWFAEKGKTLGRGR
jgi:CRP-like cAMP-binding protein